jgi:hypothetical protein
MEELDEMWAVRSMAGRKKQGSKLPLYSNSETRGDDKKCSVLKFPVQCLLALIVKLDVDAEAAIPT